MNTTPLAPLARKQARGTLPSTTLKRGLRTIDGEYHVEIRAHKLWVPEYAIRLPDPTQALRDHARAKAEASCREAARLKGWSYSPLSFWGDDFVKQLADGEVAAALLGQYWGVPHTFRDNGYPDEAGDLSVRLADDLDVKARQFFLTLNPDEQQKLRKKTGIRLLVLVEHRTPESPYWLCGAITPQKFFELAWQRRELELVKHGERRFLRYVTVQELTEPAERGPWW